MDIFKLVGSVFIDTADAENSLSKVDNKAEGTGGKLAQMAGTAGKVALGVAGAAAGIGTAMVAMADKAAQAADEVDKGSIRMGISAESYQELRYAAGQCGVEMSVMEKAAKKLEGTDINFDDAIDSIMSLSTEEERSAKAAELFGESVAYQLSPILKGTGEDLQGLRDNAHELGIVMSDEAVAAGVKMGDTMSDVKQALGAVGTEVGSALMPIVQKMLDWIIQHMPEIKKIVGEVISFVKGLIEDLTPLIEALIPIVENVFKGIVSLWETFLKPVLDGIITFLTGVFTGNWKQAFEGLSKIVGTVFEGMVALVKAPINAIIGLINDFFDSLGSIDVPEWVPFIGGKSFSIPHIPALAKGGDILGGGTVMVGEAGPELLSLPSGATVTPLSGGGGDIGAKLDAILTALQNMHVGQDIVLDTGVLVGQTVNKMDTALGRIQSQRARGV